MNSCGCPVHSMLDKAERVKDAMLPMNSVEVHAQSEDGRHVVVVEDTEEALASDLIMELHQIPGVISVTLTYHHFEDLQGGESAPQPVAPCNN